MIERNGMIPLRLISIFLAVTATILVPVSAAEQGGWANQTIEEKFVVLLPSDWSNFLVSSYAGPATGVMDNKETSNVIAIQIADNMNCSDDNQENLRVNIESVNAKAGIANLTPFEYGSDNVTEYGKYNDGKFASVFVRLSEGNVISVFGAYETMEDAKAKADQFETIARSVTPLSPGSTDICAAEKNKPTPVPTYKPRPVPTVKNTVSPTASASSP
ncbi:MAG: hypothetical protein LUQ07_01245 [Methanospirillum sp.]|nr:hypothetical protein [Methanospirillum sp.]